MGASYSILARSGLEDFGGPVFQNVLDLGHELIGQGAIDQTVVETEREVADGANRDGIVDHYRSLIDSPDTHDGGLRLVDHGRSDQAAETAKIGDGKSAAHHFVRLELARTGAGRQI